MEGMGLCVITWLYNTAIHSCNTGIYVYSTIPCNKLLHVGVLLCIGCAQVVEKELLIQEKEKLYMELKQILQRQPGPEVAEQLQIYQQALKEKTKQMKVREYKGGS